MSEQEIWDNVLSLCKENVTTVSYDTWLKDTTLYALSRDEAIVIAKHSLLLRIGLLLTIQS
nr:DnaA N-terminal domain-containing protein [Staphylococcus pseudintermedius]